MENLADDPGFIDAIVHEVKSQGLFDQFRKECLADVDTKPAYQNLRQRVETSVGKFLSTQNWSDNIRHKNQLREKLRKNIIDSGFLETGVERIVDQVVNPKISTVFHPKVEEIVYNYLGIEKPKPAVNGSGLDVQTDFLPEDLEAVSPDSDKKSSSTSSDMHITMEPSAIEPELNESKEIIDDFESPAFEPLQTRPPSQMKQESSDSHASVISGLTSQESVEDENPPPASDNDAANVHTIGNVSNTIAPLEGGSNLDGEVTAVTTSPEMVATDSQLSQVSSNSHLSIITNSGGNLQQQQEPVPNPRLDITEEAQMPKFNDNSNGEEGEIVDSDESERAIEPQKSNFDLHKESYDFKGTERCSRMIDNEEAADGDTLLEQGSKAINSELDDGKDRNPTPTDEQPKPSPQGSNKYDDDSSQSERSLRICEDSTMEQRAMDTSSHLDNCDSAKTPLNDEHSTESAPDVEKMDGSQVEVVTLGAVQQHVDGEKGSDRRHVSRSHHSRHDRKHTSSSSHRHRTSSSRDRRSHSSSKHGSSTSGSGSRKTEPRERKGENGNSHSNGGQSKRSHDKKKVSDDHYSSHDKSSKKRRSTDRDSNDGAENAKSTGTGGESGVPSGPTGVGESAKHSPESQKRSGGTQVEGCKINDSMDSSFEGFDDEQVKRERKHSPKNAANPSGTKTVSKHAIFKGPKKIKRNDKSQKDAANRPDLLNMDVFSFSFVKPSKPVKDDEQLNQETSASNTLENMTIVDNDTVLRAVDVDRSGVDTLDQLADGIIILEPTEIENVGGTGSNAEILHPSQPSPTNLIPIPVQPMVADQILSTEDNMDLKLLLGEKQLCGDETTLGKIQQSLSVLKNKTKKPKIASNLIEARRLMKIRKQIEREEKKSQEQALALVKKLINDNENASQNELEFVREGNSGSSVALQQRTNSNLTKDEKDNEADLLFFPEAKEVFSANITLLQYLQRKTSLISCPIDMAAESSNIKLYSLDHNIIDTANQATYSSLSSQRKIKQVPTVENPSSSEPDAFKSEPSEQRSACPTSNDSDTKGQSESKSFLDAERKAPKRKHSSSPSTCNHKVVKDDLTNDTANDDTMGQNAPNSRLGKARRIGLPKLKSHSPVVDSISTELSVVISEANPVVESASPTANNNNNNNGAIKGQRYSSDDLYKPRPANGLRSRTRTRAGEVQ